MTFRNLQVKSPRVKIKFELEFNNSLLTLEEIQEKLERLFKDSYNKTLSEFIMLLLRETKASTWEMKVIEITKPNGLIESN